LQVHDRTGASYKSKTVQGRVASPRPVATIKTGRVRMRL